MRDTTRHTNLAELDVVDLSGLFDGDTAAVGRVAARLEAPARTLGAFHIVGHGISREELGRFERAMRVLFDLPIAEKQAMRRSRDNAWGWFDEELTKNRPDWKEIFDFGAERSEGEPTPAHSDGVNRWPKGQDEIRRELVAHYRRCERIARPLVRALCVALGLEAGALDHAMHDHSSFLRLNRYAACPEPAPADAPQFPERGHLGVHHHTDAGVLTLLYQDDVGGLQFERDGFFQLVTPISGALTVNLGDMFQVWSNDRFQSPVHRVLAPRERTRHSAPFFLNPAYDAVAEPLAPLLGPETPARYRPLPWAHFREQRSAGDFADYGAEIQISDYRIG